jgi:hypothetical protein
MGLIQTLIESLIIKKVFLVPASEVSRILEFHKGTLHLVKTQASTPVSCPTALWQPKHILGLQHPLSSNNTVVHNVTHCLSNSRVAGLSKAFNKRGPVEITKFHESGTLSSAKVCQGSPRI